MEYSNPKDILFEDSRIDKLKNIAKDPYVVSNFFSKDEIFLLFMSTKHIFFAAASIIKLFIIILITSNF